MSTATPAPAPASQPPCSSGSSAASSAAVAQRGSASPDLASPGASRGLRALELARGELVADVHEDPPGSNTGPRIREYLAPCVREGKPLGLRFGAWCAAFASWCVSSGWWPNDPPIGYRASVAELVEDARASGAWRGIEAAEEPQPGDLLVFGRGGDPRRGGQGHVAIVETWADDRVSVISGNAGDRVRRDEWAEAWTGSPWGPVLGWIRLG